MKVRSLKGHYGDQGMKHTDDVYEVTSQKGKELIKNGLVIEVDGDEKVEIEDTDEDGEIIKEKKEVKPQSKNKKKDADL